MAPQYDLVLTDVRNGLLNWQMWGRLGWRDNKRRYRRTAIGPFWTTLSLAIFVVTLGLVWSQLWNQDPKVFMPYLASGMITWLFISTTAQEGSSTFVASESIVKQLPVSYTLLACGVVWRNLIVFAHNLLIYVLVSVYAGLSLSWATLLIIPGLLLLSLNGVWIALLLGLACARFRDIQQLVQSILQVSMFVTPIFWSAEQIKGRTKVAVDYNLLYHYVEIVRGPLLGRAPDLWSWTMVIIATVGGWALMIFLMARFRRRIPYWL